MFSDKEVTHAANHILSRKPVKYDPKKHVHMWLEICAKGDGVVEFCAKALIGRTSFYNWVGKYPEFNAAFEAGMLFSQCVWHKKGDSKDINYNYWAMMMKNRFDFTDHRKLKVPKIKGSKTFTAQFAAILKELAEGNLTSHEASQLSNLIIAGQKIEHQESVEIIRKQMIAVSEHLGLDHEALGT